MENLSLEELARKFRLPGECAYASMMFSTAMLFRKTSFISEGVLKDIGLVLSGEYGYKMLETKMSAYRKVHGKFRGFLGIEDIVKYLSLNGYDVEIYHLPEHKEKETIKKTIEDNPVIPLKFDFPGWVDFFGSGTLNDWYSSHVICAVGTNITSIPVTNGIDKEELVYFEPAAGEIRKKSFSNFNNIYGNEIAVIKPKKNKDI